MRNDIAGTVTGSLIQAGSIDRIVMAPRAAPATPIPRQLPPVVRDFTGRQGPLAALDALVHSRRPVDDIAPTIAAIEGTAGVGKTTLVLRWAHRVQDQFPDGTLFANLRGYGPSAPVDPLVVLAAFLHGLGVPDDQIPSELDEQSAMYRSVLAGRRVLIVLDNASAADQVRPLLPGSGGCVVLVTSRASLTGLVIAEAASQIVLDLFTQSEARTLITEIIGNDRVAAEPQATATLVQVCARLPLALRIAATRIAGRRHVTVADVVDDINHDRNRLVALSATGDEGSTVHAVFDWSYTRLPDQHARLFRRLGLHPDSEFSAHAAAAVADLDPVTAHRLLEALVDSHLLESTGSRRYRMHDLLRDYAQARAATDDRADDVNSARVLLIAWYASSATAADALLFPATPTPDIELGPVGVLAPLADSAQAHAWMTTELSALLGVLRTAHALGLHTHVIALAAAFRFVMLGHQGLRAVRLDAETLGIEAALACGDASSEALLLIRRGHSHQTMAHWDAAEADLRQALDLAERHGNQQRAQEALWTLGHGWLLQQRYDQAWDWFHRALPLAEQSGPFAVAIVERNLSHISACQGDFPQALRHAQRHLAARRQIGDPRGEAFGLRDVAAALSGLGEHRRAVEAAEQALAALARMPSEQLTAAVIREIAARSYASLGDTPTARAYLEQALRVFDELDDPRAASVRMTLHDLDPPSEAAPAPLPSP